jgi:hypothetical protein
MSEYPEIDGRSLTPLHRIKASLVADPAYLTSPECPYPPELAQFLAFLGGNTVETKKISVFSGVNGDKWAILEAEAAELYQDLKDFSLEIGKGDVSERMSYFRTATSLLEKIVSINERAVGLKSINDFHQTVLSVFDSELDGDQRTRIMQRLRSSIDGGASTTQEQKSA